MKHNEHEVQVVVDGTPLEEFNVDEKFDTVTNTWTYTGEIAYTHDKNFQFQMLYTAQKQGHGVKYDAYVDGQAACDLIVIGKLDEVTTECIEGFEQPGSVRPFRWTRLGLRQNAPVSSDSEPPSDVGTLSMLLKPRRNCVYTGNPFTAYSDKPFNPAARSPSSTAIKFAIVTCDDPIASRFITIDSRPDRTRPRVVMRWTYMLRDLIVEKRRQGVQESAGREGKAPTAAGETERLQARLLQLKQELEELEPSVSRVKQEKNTRSLSRASTSSIRSVPPPERTGELMSIDLTGGDEED